MLADQICRLFAASDAALAALLIEQSVIFALGEIEAAHERSFSGAWKNEALSARSGFNPEFFFEVSFQYSANAAETASPLVLSENEICTLLEGARRSRRYFLSFGWRANPRVARAALS